MKAIIACVLAVIGVLSASGQVKVLDGLKDDVGYTEPRYYVDEGGSLNFHDVVDLPFSDSLKVANEAIGKMNRSRAVWVRFDVSLKHSVPDEISLRTGRFSQVHAYIVGDTGLDSVKVGVADLGFVSNDEGDPFAIDLGLKEGQQVTLFIRVVNYSHIFLTKSFWFDIRSRNAFDNYVQKRMLSNRATTYFYVFFCGLLLFQLFYVAFQWSLMRRREYFYYGLYILALFFYFYARFSVFHANQPSIAFIDASAMMTANNALLVLPAFFYFRFARYFVDLNTNDVRLDKQFKYCEYFLLLCAVLLIGFELIPSDFPRRSVLFLSLAVQFVFSVYAMVRIYRIKATIAYFLIAGSAFALFSHILANTVPVVSPWLLKYIAPLSITMLGIIIEVAIFNSGLLYKAKADEREKVRVHKAYIAELQSRQELQTAYSQVRDKIASDLHDDIGSSLSSINIYSYAASQKLEKGEFEQAGGLLKNIERSAFETLSSMSDLVWAINPNNDTPAKLIERVQSFSYEILAAADCRFEMDVAPSFYDTSLSQAERKNILLILKEAVNNAAKYSGAKTVELKVIPVNGKAFIFRLGDDGSGLAPEKRSGNGMRTMGARAAELGGFFDVSSVAGRTCVTFGLRTMDGDVLK